MKSPKRKWLALGLALVAAGLLVTSLWLFLAPTGEAPLEITPEPVPTAVQVAPIPVGTPEPEATEAPQPETELPVGKLVTTPERATYEDGSLSLYIPILEVKRTIWNGTAPATLSKGVGLYEYAQLPGEGNRNVSLAGHRNGVDKSGRITDRAPFYYVDTLKEGDYLYLYDSTYIYRYRLQYTEIIEDDDWSPIRTTEESVLTITSCHPIGVSDQRIVVRAVLDQIFDYTDEFQFLPSEKEELP